MLKMVMIHVLMTRMTQIEQPIFEEKARFLCFGFSSLHY